MDAPAGSDDTSEAGGVFAGAPAPDRVPARRGLVSRLEPAVWATHEEKLAATRDLRARPLMDAFRASRKTTSSPRTAVACSSSTSPAAPPCASPRSARGAEQVRRETEVARASEERARTNAKREMISPDVTRLPHQPLGSLKPASGASIPLVGLGTWKSEPGASARRSEAALRAGYRHVDCASVYENEQEVGDGMAEVFLNTKLAREDVFVTSKLWNTEHAAEASNTRAARRSRGCARRTSTCTSCTGRWSPGTSAPSREAQPPLLDTWQAMELVDEGLVKPSASPTSPSRSCALARDARGTPCPCARWRFIRTGANASADRVCASRTTSTSPRTRRSARRTRRPCSARDAPALMRDPAVIDVAERAGKNVGQVLLRWALQTRPTCSVLPKSADPERSDPISTSLDWALEDEDRPDARVARHAETHGGRRVLAPPRGAVQDARRPVGRRRRGVRTSET